MQPLVAASASAPTGTASNMRSELIMDSDGRSATANRSLLATGGILSCGSILASVSELLVKPRSRSVKCTKVG